MRVTDNTLKNQFTSQILVSVYYTAFWLALCHSKCFINKGVVRYVWYGMPNICHIQICKPCSALSTYFFKVNRSHCLIYILLELQVIIFVNKFLLEEASRHHMKVAK